MNVLICGADGFLGRRLAAALEARGDQVLRGVRRPTRPGDTAIDYRCDLAPDDWTPRLGGVDAVVNAVGVLRESRPGDFDAIHRRAPAALFEACRRTGLARVVQISALGSAPTGYLQSKHAADAELLRLLPESGTVLRPGLVFGREGRSTRFFLALASLPVAFRPATRGKLQPVHVDDVVAAVLRLVDGAAVPGGVLELPGPEALSYQGWMAAYRHLLGLPAAVAVPIPAALMTAGARLAERLPGSLLSRDTWAMLRAGSHGDPAPARALLGRALRAPVAFAGPAEAPALRQQALADWRGPMFRAVLGMLWLASALLPLCLPLESSLALLAPFGLQGAAATTALVAAMGLDLAMAVLTLLRPGRRLWIAQLLLVLVYSLLVAWRLPAYLLHPFAPILKNLAVAALLLTLWSEEVEA